MSVLQLPPSYNLVDQKVASTSAGQPIMSKIRSDNADYSASQGNGDVIRISIPTGQSSWLSPQDSFITGKFTPTWTEGTGPGNVKIDGTAYSLIRRCSLYHGSSLIENLVGAGRLYNALFDVQAGASERAAGTVNLMIEEAGGIGSNMYTYGTTLVSGRTYNFSFCLPSILGIWSEKCLPLGFMDAAELYLELELEAANRVFTTRVGDTISGTVGAYTAPPTNLSYKVSEIYYNACITSLGSEVQNILKQALMSKPMVIPCISYRGEQRVVSASAGSFSDKFSFQFSSLKTILWWLTTSATANGQVISNNLNAAVTTRTAGSLDQYYCSINGSDYPASHIKAGAETADRIFGAECMGQLERAFNANVTPGMSSVLTKEVYCNSITLSVGAAGTGSDAADAKKFVGALSLDRFDNNNTNSLMGMNTMSSQVQLSLQFTTGVSESMNLYAYAQFDMALELVDGILVARY